jgi:tetratricopeptide (TPR) repeat protein
MTSAKEKLAANDVKGAVIQIKNALQKNPDSADARFLLGKALLDSGDARTALVELQKAIELQAPEHLVLPEVARAMLLTGEGKKLLAQYGETKLSDPAASADFQTSLATAYAQEGKIDKARARLDLALRDRPGYASALILDGRIMMSEGNFDGAITVLDKVLAGEPGNEQAGLLKGELLHRTKNDLDGALAANRAVLAAHPKSVTAHTSTMTILQAQKKPDLAKAQFAELKKVAPTTPKHCTSRHSLPLRPRTTSWRARSPTAS